MHLSLPLCLVNLILTLAIAARLELHKYGIFTIGFFCLGTGVFPHYVLMPLYSVLSDGEMASREFFDDGLLVVTAMLAGLLVGVLFTRKRIAPLYSRIREIDLSRRAHMVLLTGALFLALGLFFFLAGTLNPLEIIPQGRSLDFRLKYAEYDLGYPVLISLGTVLFFHGWFVVKLFSTSRTYKSLIIAIAATAVTMLVTACYGARSALFSPLVVLLFVIHHLYRRIPLIFVAALFVISIPVFVFSRLVASGFDLNNIPRGGAATFVMDEFVSRFQLFDGLLDFLAWFKHHPFQYGESLLEVFIRPIPRQLIPDKPHSFDVFMSYELYGRPYYGGGIQIFGGIAEMFYNFGYPGVFLWFVLLGNLTYRFHFGMLALLKDRRVLACTMVITNYGLLRGLTNCGVNTIASQQIVVTLFSQALFCGVVYGILRLHAALTGAAAARRRPVARDHGGAPAPSARLS